MCRSLERHRIGRAIIDKIRLREKFLQYKMLQFSDDPLVARGWFKSAEISSFGGENSIDIQDIQKPDESYDFVVCSHVIEHVPEHRRAISEMVRILSQEGLILLAYALPVTREHTEEWGYPDWTQHGRYRVLGRDFEKEFRNIVPQAQVLAVQGVDSVTEDDDRIYLLTKNQFWVRRAFQVGLDAELLNIG